MSIVSASTVPRLAACGPDLNSRTVLANGAPPAAAGARCISVSACITGVPAIAEPAPPPPPWPGAPLPPEPAPASAPVLPSSCVSVANRSEPGTVGGVDAETAVAGVLIAGGGTFLPAGRDGDVRAKGRTS